MSARKRGDACVLDELTDRYLGEFLALDNYAEHFSEHSTTCITNAYILGLFVEKFSEMLARAKPLYKQNARYQEMIASAAEALSRIRDIIEQLHEDDQEFDFGPALNLHVCQFGEHVALAEFYATGKYPGWEMSDERIAMLVGRDVADKQAEAA